ncbi:phloretin 4'-O-glucosyltransferase-like [Arachis stenosperma]|uniref:phloretin 4'-O-glucosyltransferase-like n=1 Tax=Arachis stenosperma TaxID=217475 RepID=UPI0025ABC46D|nr:phloretin 4'-O-glucosyltransferase-like [Arachis stenosperma]
MVRHRFLLVIYPAQGHINPALEFAKRLISLDSHVTLAITIYLHSRMVNKPSIPGLSIVTFSDGHDTGFNAIAGGDEDYKLYASELKRRGSDFVADLISSSAKQGHPFTCVTYTLLVQWAQEVARGFHLPSALLWIEPATVFAILYHYFHGYDNYINEKSKEEKASSSYSIALPGLPLLFSAREVPSFLLVGRPSFLSFLLESFEEQFQELDKETNPTVLVNTFEALEAEALKAIDRVNMIPIGPLIPSAFLDGKNPNDTSFGGDLIQDSNDGYIQWLNSKAEMSVVYVSFGSYFPLSKRQKEEIARALLDCRLPFLWVIRDEEELSCMEELRKKGKIVKWCSQVQVLSHASVGCFVTHCGWNSTMESLVCGVPVVAFPQWSDQKTNAKLIEQVWKIGVRVVEDEEEGIVTGGEIRRCVEMVMESNGEKAKEVRRNGEKWKIVAKDASKEGGPSDTNLKAFLNATLLSTMND